MVMAAFHVAGIARGTQCVTTSLETVRAVDSGILGADVTLR